MKRVDDKESLLDEAQVSLTAILNAALSIHTDNNQNKYSDDVHAAVAKYSYNIIDY
jgi:hypothetical protein